MMDHEWRSLLVYKQKEEQLTEAICRFTDLFVKRFSKKVDELLSKSNPFELVRTKEVVHKIREIQKVEVEKIKRHKKVSAAEKMAHDIMKQFDTMVLSTSQTRDALRSILSENTDE